MKYDIYRTLILCIELLLPTVLSAQKLDSLRTNQLTVRCVQYGIGHSNILDTYLSPQEYKGIDFRTSRETMKRSTLALNLSPEFFDKHLTLNLNAKGIYAKNRFADTGAIGAAISYDPTQGVYDTSSNGLQGYRIWRNSAGGINTMATQNPVAMLEQKNDKSTVKRLVGNAQFDYKFFYVPGLRANLNLGLDFSTSDGTVDTPEGSEMT